MPDTRISSGWCEFMLEFTNVHWRNHCCNPWWILPKYGRSAWIWWVHTWCMSSSWFWEAVLEKLEKFQNGCIFWQMYHQLMNIVRRIQLKSSYIQAKLPEPRVWVESNMFAHSYDISEIASEDTQKKWWRLTKPMMALKRLNILSDPHTFLGNDETTHWNPKVIAFTQEGQKFSNHAPWKLLGAGVPLWGKFMNKLAKMCERRSSFPKEDHPV